MDEVKGTPGAAHCGEGWFHKVRDFPERRVTVSVGPYRVALRIPACDAADEDYGWYDPPDLPASVTLTFDVSSSAPRSEAEVLDWSASRLEIHGKYARGSVDFDSGLGQFTIYTGIASPRGVFHGALLEAAMAVLLHQVVHDGGLMLHAASLLLDDHAHVVFGRSGAGKTTLVERLPDSYLNEEFAFLVPADGGWRWLWYAQSRTLTVERPHELPLGLLLALADKRFETTIDQEDTTADALTRLVGSVFWLPGMPTDLLLSHCAALVDAHAVREFSHCLETPAAEVAALIEGRFDDISSVL